MRRRHTALKSPLGGSGTSAFAFHSGAIERMSRQVARECAAPSRSISSGERPFGVNLFADLVAQRPVPLRESLNVAAGCLAAFVRDGASSRKHNV